MNHAPTFSPPNGTGKLIVPVGNFGDYAQAVALQPDGKMVVAGYSSGTANSSNDFSVVRLNSDGSLDTTFNGTGKNILVDSSGQEYAYDVVVQADGGIVLVGTNTFDYKIIRLKPDGTLDTSFNNGVSLYPVGTNVDRAFSAFTLPDGKILVSGNSNDAGILVFSLVRLNANGTLDTTFATTGKFVTPVAGDVSTFAGGHSIAVTADGHILLSGSSGHEYAIYQLNANGSLNTSFGTAGLAKVAIGPGSSDDFGRGIIALPDGKIAVAGYSANGSSNQWDFSITRLNSDGSVDTTFGADGTGKVLINVGESGALDFASGFARQDDGSFLISGYTAASSTAPYGLGLVRVNANGTVDSQFNNQVRTAINLGASSFQTVGFPRNFDSTAVKVQADGKIALVGNVKNGTDYDYAVIRLNKDGTLDTAFNSTAFINTLEGSFAYTENATPIALDTSVAIYDVELAAANGGLGNYAGASLSLARQAGANPDDAFTASDKLTLANGRALWDATDIGSAEMAGGRLTILFNANATQAAVNGLASSLRYASASDAPPSNLVIEWTLTDGSLTNGNSLTGTGSTRVTITPVNDLPSGEVTVSGTLIQGQTLQASNTLRDADGIGTVSYQWQANGVNIADATSSTYMLTAAQIGKTNSVRASYIDAFGNVESKTSEATATVLAPDLTAPLALSFNPANAAQGAALDSNITVTFNEPIAAGAGSIVLRSDSGAELEVLNSPGASRATFSGNTLTLDPALNLAHGRDYTVEFSAGSVKDLAGNDFAGLTTYHFRTLSDPANQLFSGTTLGEQFTGGTGNDTIDGAGGIDTATYSGHRADYQLKLGAGSTPTAITDTRSNTGNDGSDTLTGIERLKFADTSVALDLDGHAGQAVKLLGAIFGSTAVNNPAFVGVALAFLDAGYSETELAKAALTLQGASDSAAVATLLWTNMFGSAPTASETAAVVGELTRGMLPETLAVLVAESDTLSKKIDLVGLAAVGVAFEEFTL